MDRERRKSRVPVQREKQVFHKGSSNCDTYNCKWTLADKKKLLAGLRKYHFSEIAKIQEHFLPSRSWLEIKNFIRKMKAKSYVTNVLPKEKVPMELWTEMADELTANITDYSSVLSEVFSQIQNGEEHDDCSKPEDPNWKSIYNYLVMHLKGQELPEVGQIEAAILLDLLEAVALHLRSHDISSQVHLMERRYALLSAPISSSNKLRAFELAQRAFEDDLPTCTIAINRTVPEASSTRQTPEVSSKPAENMLATSSDRSSNDHTVDDETGSAITVAMDRVRKIQEAPLYTINPFCIPIKYLNPKLHCPIAPTKPCSHTKAKNR